MLIEKICFPFTELERSRISYVTRVESRISLIWHTCHHSRVLCLFVLYNRKNTNWFSSSIIRSTFLFRVATLKAIFALAIILPVILQTCKKNSFTTDEHVPIWGLYSFKLVLAELDKDLKIRLIFMVSVPCERTANLPYSQNSVMLILFQLIMLYYLIYTHIVACASLHFAVRKEPCNTVIQWFWIYWVMDIINGIICFYLYEQCESILRYSLNICEFFLHDSI